MDMPILKETTSVRLHPELASLFKAAENRYLSEDDLLEYVRVLPAMSPRAAAAREIYRVEHEVVDRVVDEIYALYPFEKAHAHARVKCVRDVRSVSCYASLAMLMNDPGWYRDKLLLWLRTILQSFGYPDRATSSRRVLFGSSAEQELSNLPVKARSIYDTYNKLNINFAEKLSEPHYALIEPYLKQARDTLSA